MEAWRRLAASEGGGDPRVQQRRVLAVDLQHAAVRGHDAHRGGERIVGQAEVVDHEGLRGGDAGLDRCRQLGQRVVGVAADGEAQADVDGTVAVGRGAPLADASEERAFRGRGGAGPGVVEGEERGRATERGRDRVLVEAVRHRVRGDPRVGVDVDDAGEHQEPGRIDHLGRARRRARQVRLDRLDDPAPDRDVRPPRPGRGHHGPAADDEVGHSTSVIRIDWAPSQRHRRPISRSRSSQPSSGTTDAKWLAASCPTFEAVVQPPYGKKISHSLMPPG